MEYELNHFQFEVDPLASYRDELASRDKRPSLVEAQLISDTHDFMFDWVDFSQGPFTFTYDAYEDDFTNYRMTEQEASPMSNPSPYQLPDLDLSPVSTFNDDLVGNSIQPSMSPSLLNLANVSISADSPLASPLLDIPELSGFPCVADTASAEATQTSSCLRRDSILGLTFGPDSPEPATESESNFTEQSEDKDSDSDYNDDDEYIPISVPKPKSRARARAAPQGLRTRPSKPSTRFTEPRTSRHASHSPRFSPYPASPSESSSGLSEHSRSDSPALPSAKLQRTTSRKKQVSCSSIDMPPREGAAKWACPHCNYVQVNRRLPDLRRHVLTHSKGDNILCCGVLLAQAAAHGVPEDKQPAEWKGEIRVGGCWKTFSRRDALRRHLRKGKEGCVSDVVDSEALKALRRRK